MGIHEHSAVGFSPEGSAPSPTTPSGPAPVPSVSGDYTARDGKVFIRGVFHTEAECARLAEVFRLSATAGDWFAPFATALAAELEQAIADAAWQQHQLEEAA